VRVALVVVGALVLLTGAVFAGQGLGYIPGSIMTGDMKWFWIGSAMVVVGVVLGGAGLVRPARNFVEFPKDAFDHVVKALISGRRWKPHDAESL